MKTLSICLFLFTLLSCEQEPTVRPSDERVLYPAECDYSPIPYGSIKIYSIDSQLVKIIEVDYEHNPDGAYYVNLPNDTYHFDVTSDYTGKSSYSTLKLNSGESAVDLWACEP